MRNFDYPEHHCNSAEEAIALAQALSDAGTYDLFRGQRHTFPIMPSIARPDVDPVLARERLELFAQWVHGTEDLASLHNKPNAILAVAQHYGLRTPLMDVSTSPDIAGFFATDGGEDGHVGTIICFNRQRFTESWADLNDRYRASSGRDLTSIIEIDVSNLWRLNAQKGLFIKSHVDPTVLEMFSHMLHIYFPQKAGTKIIDRDAIYPKERSHLEVLLDQYFLIETYESRSAALSEMFGTSVRISQSAIDKEIASFFIGDTIPDAHSSWANAEVREWLKEPAESLPRYGSRRRASLLLPGSKETAELEDQIQDHIKSAGAPSEQHRGHIEWHVTFPDGAVALYTGEGITREKSDFTEFSVADMLQVIYDGMRYLPYTDRQIARAMARYLVMVTFDCYETIPDAEGIEFVGRDIRGRGFCSRSRLRGAIRSDFFQLVKPDRLNGSGAISISDLMFAASHVPSGYNFDKFVELFVEDVIPSQAAVAVEGLVIGLNPARIEVFGES